MIKAHVLISRFPTSLIWNPEFAISVYKIGTLWLKFALLNRLNILSVKVLTKPEVFEMLRADIFRLFKNFKFHLNLEPTDLNRFPIDTFVSNLDYWGYHIIMGVCWEAPNFHENPKYGTDPEIQTQVFVDVHRVDYQQKWINQ